MEKKRLIRGGPDKTPDEVRAEGERVSPTVALMDPNGETAVKDFRVVRVVMTDRRHAAEQVLDPSPPETGPERDAKVFTYRRVLGAVDIPRPGYCVLVGAAP